MDGGNTTNHHHIGDGYCSPALYHIMGRQRYILTKEASTMSKRLDTTLMLVIALAFTGLLLMGVNSCDLKTNEPKSSSGVRQATVKVKTQASGLTSEQENIVRKLKEDNKVGAIKYLYIVSAYSGDVLIYSTVKGKVTSSGKRLSPYSVMNDYGTSEDGIDIKIGGLNYTTGEVLQDDGTYGHSIPYLYWWDTKDVGHKHYVSGGQIIHVSDAPLVVGKVIINLDLQK